MLSWMNLCNTGYSNITLYDSLDEEDTYSRNRFVALIISNCGQASPRRCRTQNLPACTRWQLLNRGQPLQSWTAVGHWKSGSFCESVVHLQYTNPRHYGDRWNSSPSWKLRAISVNFNSVILFDGISKWPSYHEPIFHRGKPCMDLCWKQLHLSAEWHILCWWQWL